MPYSQNTYMVGIRSVADYSPFGVELDGRTQSGGGYRYGYQGSEKDNELKGAGNSYTTYFRQLDPRIGRWLTVDPKTSQIPWQSVYTSMDNNPVSLVDPMGDKTGGEKGEKLEEKEKKLEKRAQKLEKREKKLAEKFAKKVNGIVNAHENEYGYKRYQVGYTNDSGESSFRAFKSTASRWKGLGMEIAANQDALYGKYYLAGEAIGIQLSFSSEFFVCGGASYSLDVTMVGDTKVLGYTIGGGIGIGTGIGFDYKIIHTEKSGRYTAEDVQKGAGFSFNASLAFINYTRSGNNRGHHEFQWTGKDFTLNGGSISELLPAKALSPTNYNQAIRLLFKGFRYSKVKAGASYQWTTGGTYTRF